MTRKTTWSNSDGLVVGYGPNFPERNEPGIQEAVANNKVAKFALDAVNSTFGSGAGAARLVLPVGSIVKNVYARITETHVGGTSISFGDVGNVAGFILAASWGTPAADAVIQADGLYAVPDTATDDVVAPPKEYAAGITLYFTKVGTYTAGKADVYVEYV